MKQILTLTLCLLLVANSFAASCTSRYCLTCDTATDTCTACYPNSEKVTATTCGCSTGYQLTGVSSNGIVCEAKTVTNTPADICKNELATYAFGSGLKLTPTSKVVGTNHVFSVILTGETVSIGLKKCFDDGLLTQTAKVYQAAPDHPDKSVVATQYLKPTLTIPATGMGYFQFVLTIPIDTFSQYGFEEDFCEANGIIDFFISTEIGIKGVATSYIITSHNGRIMFNKSTSVTLGSFIVDPKYITAKCVCTNVYTIPITIEIFKDAALSQPLLKGGNIGIGAPYWLLIKSTAGKKITLRTLVQSDDAMTVSDMSQFAETVTSEVNKLVVKSKFITPGKSVGLQVEVDFVMSRLLSNLKGRVLAAGDPTEDFSGNYVDELSIGGDTASNFMFISQIVLAFITLVALLI